MKRIFILIITLFIIFIFGCTKGDSNILEITSQTVGIDADDTKEETVEEEAIEPVEEVEEDITTVRLCHDTDNGIVRWVNGSIFGFYDDAERFEFNDYCFNNNILIEYYCEDETPQNFTFLCRNGCEDNHCL